MKVSLGNSKAGSFLSLEYPGIGNETLKALHATGAHVFSTVRDVEKGQAAVDSILAEKIKTGGKITLIKMELDSLASVRAGAQDFLQQSKILNVLINNAGVMATPEGRTKDSFETQFGTNHLSHFLLFELLKPTLLASATPEFPSRVVSVSSIGHRSGSVQLHDYNFDEPGSYSPGLPTAKPRPQTSSSQTRSSAVMVRVSFMQHPYALGEPSPACRNVSILRRQSHGTRLPRGRT